MNLVAWYCVGQAPLMGLMHSVVWTCPAPVPLLVSAQAGPVPLVLGPTGMMPLVTVNPEPPAPPCPPLPSSPASTTTLPPQAVP